jgi:hypothetical protein
MSLHGLADVECPSRISNHEVAKSIPMKLLDVHSWEIGSLEDVVDMESGETALAIIEAR